MNTERNMKHRLSIFLFLLTLAAVSLAFSAVAEADYGNGYRDRGIMLEVSPQKLVVRSQDCRHPGTPDLDVVEIASDGTARSIGAQ